MLVVAGSLAACSGLSMTRSADSAAEVPARVSGEYGQALEHMQNGDDVRALDAFTKFVADHPGYPGGAMNLAKLQLRNGLEDDALTTLEACLDMHPDYAPAHNQLGIIYREQGQFDLASDKYMDALEADPDYALAYFNLGVLNDLYRQQPVVALDYYQQYRSRIAPEVDDQEVDRWIRDLQRRTGTAQNTVASPAESTGVVQ